MIAIASLELIAELDHVVTAGSLKRRGQILRRITSLFLSGAARLSEEHIELFDDVFIRLMDCIDAPTLAAFSAMLSKQTSAPRHTIRRLAFDGDATVAAPVLLKSATLAEADLAEIAGSRGQKHLLAIAGRRPLGEVLTDILLARGDSNVYRELANNGSARLSRRGFPLLFAAAERDDDISDLLVMRSDVPVDLVYQFVAKSTRVVQARLLKIASAQLRETVRAAAEDAAIRTNSKKRDPIDYSQARSTVAELNKAGKLNDSSVNRFAIRGERNNAVAALSLLACVPIETVEQLMEESDCCGIVVACRASRLDWQTAKALIDNRKGGPKLSQAQIQQTRTFFDTLSLSIAQRAIRYGSVNDVAVKAGGPMMPSRRLGAR
jgi:uncharacterized protein (DUF2336 family)